MSDGCHAESAGGGGEEVVVLPVVLRPHHQHCAAHRGGPLNKVITWFPTVLPSTLLSAYLPPYFSPLFFSAVSSLCFVFRKLHFLLFPHRKLAGFIFTHQVAIKKFSHKLSALVRPERSLFSSVLPHRFLERELSRMIPSSPASPKNSRQVHLSQNSALEPVTADICCYSWVSVGVVGMLFILCWHGSAVQWALLERTGEPVCVC